MPEPTAPLPWEGRAERADRILVAGIVISGLYSLALLPVVPSLIDSHPALLELLRGSIASMVNMGARARTGETSIVLALTLALPSLVMFDWLYWWAGARWGERGLAMLLGNDARAQRRRARLHRYTHRFGPVAIVLAYVLPVPSVLIYFAAGWDGMRLRTFLLLDLLGAVLWVVLNVALGYAIGQSAVDVAKSVSHYALWATIALVVVVVLLQMRSAQPRSVEGS